jgi:hypothetical protein
MNKKTYSQASKVHTARLASNIKNFNKLKTIFQNPPLTSVSFRFFSASLFFIRFMLIFLSPLNQKSVI